MGKYWELFRAGLLKSSFYRLATAASLVSSVLYIVLLYSVWSAIASSGSLEGGLSRVLSYIVLAQVIRNATSVDVEEYFGERIRKGKITTDLKRPVSVFAQAYLTGMGERTFKILTRAVPLLVLGILFTEIALPSIVNLIGFLASIFLGLNLMFSVAYCTAMLVFWTKVDSGLRFTRSMSINFLSGVVFPLYLLPEPLKEGFYLLPFHLIVDGPINIFQMRTTGNGVLDVLAQQALWILVFLLVGQLLWIKARRKLTVQGG